MGTFIPALIHPAAFKVFNTGIPIANVTRASIGGGNTTTAGPGILGEGLGRIQALALNTCFLSNAAPPGPATTIDPPQTYNFCTALSPYGRDFLNLNLRMVRADDFLFNIQVILNGQPLNCNGGTLRMTVKWAVTDLDANEIFSLTSPSGGITWINQTLGTASILIPSADTNITAIPYHTVNLPYDIRFTDLTGKIKTVMSGTLTVVPNTSQTSP